MTFLIERLAELRKHLDHLDTLRPRVSAGALRRDLSLENDVLHSLLMVCQLVIDVASELSSRHGLPFDDYTEAVRNVGRMALVDDSVLGHLERLPGFRNVVVHEYVALDVDRVVDALNQLETVRTSSTPCGVTNSANTSGGPDPTVQAVPEACHPVTPHVLADDVDRLVEFPRAAFGAVVRVQREGPGQHLLADGDAHQGRAGRRSRRTRSR